MTDCYCHCHETFELDCSCDCDLDPDLVREFEIDEEYEEAQQEYFDQ